MKRTFDKNVSRDGYKCEDRSSTGESDLTDRHLFLEITNVDRLLTLQLSRPISKNLKPASVAAR